ncbi:hypothetical protein KM043_009966 [Ampulex compressa]|nr:hypothetical protein KM043_009966 [Ampulex compressa]
MLSPAFFRANRNSWRWCRPLSSRNVGVQRQKTLGALWAVNMSITTILDMRRNEISFLRDHLVCNKSADLWKEPQHEEVPRTGVRCTVPQDLPVVVEVVSSYSTSSYFHLLVRPRWATRGLGLGRLNAVERVEVEEKEDILRIGGGDQKDSTREDLGRRWRIALNSRCSARETCVLIAAFCLRFLTSSPSPFVLPFV